MRVYAPAAASLARARGLIRGLAEDLVATIRRPESPIVPSEPAGPPGPWGGRAAAARAGGAQGLLWEQIDLGDGRPDFRRRRPTVTFSGSTAGGLGDDWYAAPGRTSDDGSDGLGGAGPALPRDLEGNPGARASIGGPDGDSDAGSAVGLSGAWRLEGGAAGEAGGGGPHEADWALSRAQAPGYGDNPRPPAEDCRWAQSSDLPSGAAEGAAIRPRPPDSGGGSWRRPARVYRSRTFGEWHRRFAVQAEEFDVSRSAGDSGGGGGGGSIARCAVTAVEVSPPSAAKAKDWVRGPSFLDLVD